LALFTYGVVVLAVDFAEELEKLLAFIDEEADLMIEEVALDVFVDEFVIFLDDADDEDFDDEEREELTGFVDVVAAFVEETLVFEVVVDLNVGVAELDACCIGTLVEDDAVRTVELEGNTTKEFMESVSTAGDTPNMLSFVELV